MKRKWVMHVVLPALLLMQHTAQSCPSCFGDANSTEVQATKWAIAALLGVTGTVLVGVGSFFIYLRKRANELTERFSNRLN